MAGSPVVPHNKIFLTQVVSCTTRRMIDEIFGALRNLFLKFVRKLYNDRPLQNPNALQSADIKPLPSTQVIRPWPCATLPLPLPKRNPPPLLGYMQSSLHSSIALHQELLASLQPWWRPEYRCYLTPYEFERLNLYHAPVRRLTTHRHPTEEY